MTTVKQPRAGPQSIPLGTALGQAQVFAQHTGQTATGSLTDQEHWASHFAQPQPSWSTNLTMGPDMSPTGSAQQTELQGPVTESMIMDPSCDDEWGPDLYCTPAPPGTVQSATPAGRKLMQQAYSSSRKFATANLQPYPEPVKTANGTQ